MSEPQDITRSPSLLVTLMSWAEAGAVVEPSAGRKSTGWLAADLVTKEELNWLDREPYRWLRALFSRYLSSGEALVGSWFVDKGTGIWSDDAVGPLQGFLSDGPAGTASLVTDLWLDPNDTGAVRIQVNAAKAFPAQFLANKDTYIFVPIDLIVPPTVSEPELALLDVPVGNPAPATPAGHVLVWRVETDGAGIVDQEIFLPDFPVLKQVGFEIISAAIAMVQGDLDVGGNVEIDGTLDVTGNSILGVDETNVQQVHGSVTVGTDGTSAVTVPGTLGVTGNSTLGDSLGDTATVTGSLIVNGEQLIQNVPSLSVGLTVTGAGDAGAGAFVGGANTAVTASATGSLPTAVIVNSGSGRAQFVQNNDAVNCALRVENLGVSAAVEATSAGPQETIYAENTGTGPAVTAVNNDATAATIVCSNNGVGPGLAALSDIVLLGTAQVLGGATAKVMAGTLDTIDADGAAKVGELQFYEDTPSVAAGVVQFDGRAVALGDGVTAPRLAAPMLDTVPSVSTGAGIADTGASKALNMRTGEDAKIVITATARNTITGVNIVFIADANGASIGNTTSFYEPNAIGGAVQTVTRIIRYTHGGADASVTFKAQFGANAGTTHLTDVSVEASHI